jgi:two-component system sensor histidine kinase PilS (NtrC family)
VNTPGEPQRPPPPQPAEQASERREGDRRAGDRRVGDRRQRERRGVTGAEHDESWFGAIGVDSGRHSDPGESFFDPGWVAADELPADSRFVSREARRVATAQETALARIHRTYAAARAVVGLVLVAAQLASGMLGARPALPATLLCVAYAVQASSVWLLPRVWALAVARSARRRARVMWAATIGVDLVAFGGLHLLELGSSFNFAALLVLPVLMAGVLSRRVLALGTAAAVTLLLLFTAWRAAQAGGDLNALMMQAGLAGLGLFVITLLAGELAGRLVREELAARGSLELARQQAQLNRLMIEEMVDGVLVVDHRLRVRAANPAARALLADEGLAPSAPFQLASRRAWAQLAQAVEAALAEPSSWPEAGRDVAVEFEGGVRRTLRVRMRFLRRRDIDAGVGGGDAYAVLLLEDVRTAAARLQQEKLAAMGRVSAGIAHEIRNPLAAIAQANALLAEDELAPTQQRLTRVVADNVERLKRIVEEVMEVAPGAAPVVRAIDVKAEVSAVVADWARTVGLTLGAQSRLQVDLPAQPLGGFFDPEHLRRVLVNLLDNAQRHASAAPGASLLQLAPIDAHRLQLIVASDSPPIPPAVENHLFEPFFSTRSRGTGLGLYICRELCERNGATIEYRARPASARLRNEFRVLMRRGTQEPANATLGLEP